MRLPSTIKNLKVSWYADIGSITSIYLAFYSCADSGKQRAKSLKRTTLSSSHKTFNITGETDCDVTFSNHPILRQTASANNTSMTLPVPRKTFRVKAHVQLTQCHTHRHEMKLDTGAQVGCGINDMSSDGMQEEECFFIHNYWFQSST